MDGGWMAIFIVKLKLTIYKTIAHTGLSYITFCFYVNDASLKRDTSVQKHLIVALQKIEKQISFSPAVFLPRTDQ